MIYPWCTAAVAIGKDDYDDFCRENANYTAPRFQPCNSCGRLTMTDSSAYYVGRVRVCARCHMLAKKRKLLKLQLMAVGSLVVIVWCIVWLCR